MSKRLIRIKSKDAFKKLDKLIGAAVNAISKNGNTNFGLLTAITSDHITITDYRSHIHKLEILDLYEVILDTTDELQNISIK